MVSRNEVEIKVTVDESDAKKGFKKTRVEADKTKDSVNKLGGAVKAMSFAFVGAGVAAVGFATIAVRAASDLQESINAVGVVFGDAAGQITDFGTTAAREVGLANSEFNQLATTTGAMLKNVGFSQTRMASETIRLTKRAADMASVFNTDVTQALSAINAALRGEIDPIERFGVSMNIATVEAKALELGLANTKAEISAADKQVARLAVIMEQTAVVEGDFANTSDEFANAVRILKSDLTDLSASLGTDLIPTVEKGVKTIGSMVAQIKEWKEEGASLDDIILDVAAASDEIKPGIETVDGLTRAFGALGGEVKGLEFKAPFLPNSREIKSILEITDAITGLVSGEDFDTRVAVRQAEKMRDVMNELVEAGEKAANFPGAGAPFDMAGAIDEEKARIAASLAEKALNAHLANQKSISESKREEGRLAKELLLAEEAKIAAEEAKIALVAEELFLRNNAADVLEIEAHWLQEQGRLQQQLVDAASEELRIKMEAFQLQQRAHAFAVAGSTRSADLIAASGGLGPEGGGGISAHRQAAATIAVLDDEGNLIGTRDPGTGKLTLTGSNEAQQAVDAFRQQAQQQGTAVNVYLEESQVNSRLGQSADDGA